MTTASTIHPRERGSVRATDPDTSQWAADSIQDALVEQQNSFSHLAFEAICAALAAERDLWQEEES